MAIKQVVTQTQVAVYVQPDGPFTPMVVFEEGMVGISDITLPGPGARTVNYRADVHGRPVALNATRAAPAQPAFSIENYLGKVRDYFEKARHNGTCYVIQVRIHGCESLDHPAGWEKVYHFGDVLTGDATLSAPASREFADGNVGYSTPQQPIYDFMLVRQGLARLTTTEAENINGVDFVSLNRGCKNCPDSYPGPDQIGYFTADAGAAAIANILYTKDGGSTIAVVSAFPGIASEDVNFPQIKSLNLTQWRLITGRTTTDGANAAEIYHASPTKGIEETTVWSPVDVGANTGDVITAMKWLTFARLYIAYGAGVIALSEDQGETNADKFTGSNIINDFAMNPRNGNVYAVGAAGTILVEKGFSGSFEALVGPTGSPAISSISIANDNTLWIGSTTKVFRSTTPLPTSANHWIEEKDFGATNLVLKVAVKGGERALGGDSQVLHILVSQAAAAGLVYITLDGASFTEPLTSLSNSGYTTAYFSPVDDNVGYIVGLTDSATGLIHKMSPESGV